jgi:molybdopterin-guanine dinucleotide biosynthesis protein A
MLELAADADIVMPVHGEDSFEPLHAIYRKTVIPVARELLDEGR